MPRFNKLLVIDIDETLIFSSYNILGRIPDFTFKNYCIYTRPGVDYFLDVCLEWFEVGIWTTASEDYAMAVTDVLFKDKNKPSFIWSRQHCIKMYNRNTHQNHYVIDINKLKKRGFNIKNIIIIDDSRKKTMHLINNTLIVRKYLGEEDDNELYVLLNFLEQIGDCNDIRTVKKDNWRNVNRPDLNIK